MTDIPFDEMICMNCGGAPILAGTGHCRPCLADPRAARRLTQVPTGCNLPAPRTGKRSEHACWCQRPQGHSGNHKYYGRDGSALREWQQTTGPENMP